MGFRGRGSSVGGVLVHLTMHGECTAIEPFEGVLAFHRSHKLDTAHAFSKKYRFL